MEHQQTELFKVLSVGSRIKIIELLKSRGPMCVGDLAVELDISPSAVSQHLKVLRLSGLVCHERHGYWVAYTVNPEALDQCCQKVIKICIYDRGADEDEKKPDPSGVKSDLEALRDQEKKLRQELTLIQECIKEMEQEEG